MAGLKWKTDNARLMSRYYVYSQENDLHFLEMKAEAMYTQNAYNFLLTIPPARIDPERVFSSVGIHCTKLRFRTSNMLFLCTYFAKKKQIGL